MASDTSFRLDTTDLKKLARDLERTVPGTKAAMVAAIKKGGLITAIEARSLASWSSRIPGSIRVAGGFGKVVVRAGGARAPHAGPYEHGGNPGEFRHPVFGNRHNWVTQHARPFLRPALEATAPAVEVIVRRDVDEIFRAAGFH